MITDSETMTALRGDDECAPGRAARATPMGNPMGLPLNLATLPLALETDGKPEGRNRVPPHFSPITAGALGVELGALRGALLLREVAKGTGLDASDISKWENGSKLISERSLERLLDFYDVQEERRQRLLNLRESATKVHWWAPFREILDHQMVGEIEVEAKAALLEEIVDDCFGYLLQHPNARQENAQYYWKQPSPDDAELWLEVHRRRQQRLFDNPPLRVHTLVHELAFERSTDPDVMIHQLTLLRDLTAQGHVVLHVIPKTSGAAGRAFFRVKRYSFDEEDAPTYVFSEALTAGTVQESEREEIRFKRAWARLSALALSPEESNDLLHRRLKDWQ
ncbi:Scr1 family TA system antitoxin-like transcriptional regulator [Kitasatospora sp. NPDC092286]|uniref:Scr1 family TA system antitoxin-like transcriptional regulator n=1 Tax=Kitasatospora sp. NPDC092286 TaxID=3364087 RepID=UPI003802A708